MTAEMKTVIAIPARYGSARLPGKPLLDIAGVPMIIRVWKRCCAVRGVSRIIVATDDQRIVSVLREAGAEARITSSDHRSGTDRVAEAVRDIECDLVVNVQGDEPFIEPAAVESLIGYFVSGGSAPVATLATALREGRDLLNPSVVKVLVGLDGRAVYFSRFPIPFRREMWDVEGTEWTFSSPAFTESSIDGYFRHVGVYAFRPAFLQVFTSLEPTPAERAERLEQLRVLENGEKIQVVVSGYREHGVDTAEDLERARRRARGDA